MVPGAHRVTVARLTTLQHHKHGNIVSALALTSHQVTSVDIYKLRNFKILSQHLNKQNGLLTFLVRLIYFKTENRHVVLRLFFILPTQIYYLPSIVFIKVVDFNHFKNVLLDCSSI